MGEWAIRKALQTFDVIDRILGNTEDEVPECDWCYSKDIKLVERSGSTRTYECNEDGCGCKFETYTKLTGRLSYKMIKAGHMSMQYKYRQQLDKTNRLLFD